MGTKLKFPHDSGRLFGKTRQAVLALLYGRDKEALYLRQIVRAVSQGQGAVQRELAHLTAGGVLVRARRGNQVYYQANPNCPIFRELKSLIIKTAGAADVLRTALRSLSDRIEAAFIYGSIAAGTDKSDSDIDFLVIGKATFGQVTDITAPLQEKLMREINPSVYSPAEFRAKLKSGSHFLKTVMGGPKIFLMGEQRELEKLGEKRLAD